MATVLSVFKVAQKSFLQKPLTKDTAQMALFLVFNDIANTKIAFCTYLNLTFNGNYFGHKLGYKGNTQLLAVTAKAVKVGAGAIAKLKSLE